MYLTIFRTLLAALLFASWHATAGDDFADWNESDDDVTQVNEGELSFLPEVHGRRILRSRNWLNITPASLATGWVGLYQCQSNLDPVDAVEVVYRYDGMRKLRIVSSRGMGRAFVERNSVQMKNVQEGAAICIEAEVKILKPDGKGGYVMQSGPFHRRFLDGYYPLRLDYNVRWPVDLRLASVQPDNQPGFSVYSRPGEMRIDTLFDGKMTIHTTWQVVPRDSTEP